MVIKLCQMVSRGRNLFQISLPTFPLIINILNSMLHKTISALANRKLTHFSKRGFLSEKKQPEHDIIFIRHAQSMFNKACEDYRVKNGIPYVWKALCSHEGFDERVLFNYKFVDTRLTEQGKAQCRKTREKLDQEEIDCVLVSPQTRALQTYKQILGHRGLPTYAEPLLSGPLRSCVDLSRQTVSKLNEFPEVNFRAMHELEDLWFLDYLTFEQQMEVIRRLEQKGLRTFRERCQELLKMLKEEKIFQDAFQYRKRIQIAKNRICEYQKRYKRIAVVCHYYTIEYMGAKQYEECGVPVYNIDIKNCRPYYSNLSQLLSVEQKCSSYYPDFQAHQAHMALA